MTPDNLRSARNSYAVIWQRFLKLFARKPNALYCFFEGEDAKYYGLRIEMFIRPLEYHFLACGGKGNVLRLLSLLNGDDHYNMAWACFFVDRDFDAPEDHPTDAKLYVTPTYSVENLYSTQSTFESILKCEFQIDNVNDTSADDFMRAVELYEYLMPRILDALTELNAWLHAERTLERTIGSRQLDINGLDVRKLVKVDLNEVQKNYSWTSVQAETSNAHVVTEEQVALSDLLLEGEDRASAFRGKWVLSLFVVLLRDLITDANSRPPALFSQHRNVRLNVSGNVLSDLCQYAETPPCLRDFLLQHKQTS